jgi:hypothetical protein
MGMFGKMGVARAGVALTAVLVPTRCNKRVSRSLAIVLSCVAAFSGAKRIEAQTLLWSVSLKPLGWQDPYAQVDTAKPVQWDSPIYRQELAVGPAGDVYIGLNRFEQSPAKSKMLRVVQLDGKSGSAVRQTDFPTPKLDRTAVLMAGDGTLLVVAGDRVQRVRSDGTTQQSIPLPPQPDINPGLWVTESPSGRTLLLTTDEKTFRFVRTDTLAAIAECRSKNEELDELNDSLAISMFDGSHGFELHEGQFCAHMSLLWSVADRSNEVRLLDNQNVLEFGVRHVRLFTLKDKPVWNWDSPGKAVPEKNEGIAIPISENRVAFPIVVFHNLPRPPCHDVCPLGSFTDSPQRPSCEVCPGTPRYETEFLGIVVLDTATGKQLGIVPLHNADSNKLAFALSPDGHNLAIMNNAVVELWSL